MSSKNKIPKFSRERFELAGQCFGHLLHEAQPKTPIMYLALKAAHCADMLLTAMGHSPEQVVSALKEMTTPAADTPPPAAAVPPKLVAVPSPMVDETTKAP